MVMADGRCSFEPPLRAVILAAGTAIMAASTAIIAVFDARELTSGV
jgi:hypothetical protein